MERLPARHPAPAGGASLRIGHLEWRGQEFTAGEIEKPSYVLVGVPAAVVDEPPVHFGARKSIEDVDSLVRSHAISQRVIGFQRRCRPLDRVKVAFTQSFHSRDRLSSAP